MRKKHVDYAMNGEPEYERLPLPTENYLPVPQIESPKQEMVIFKLVNKKKGRLYLDGQDDVPDPVTGKVTRIRILSGVDSIWMKDQKELTQDFINQAKRSLLFENEICRIPVWDTQQLEFARICRHNVQAPNRKSGSKYEFYEYDANVVAKRQLEKEMLEIEMAIVAKEQSVDQMKKHASFLGITFINELGRVKPDESIRAEYMIKAKRNPVHFKNTLGSKEVEVSYMVKVAIIDSKIDVGGSDGNIYWASGGQIAKLPKGRNALEYLTELALTNSGDGKRFLEQLKSVST